MFSHLQSDVVTSNLEATVFISTHPMSHLNVQVRHFVDSTLYIHIITL